MQNGRKESALSQANKMYREKVEIPRSYLEALWQAQFLEFLLQTVFLKAISKVRNLTKSSGINFAVPDTTTWNSSKYLKAIQQFYPREENRNLYEKVGKALTRRNDFIHSCFKVRKGKWDGMLMDSSSYLNQSALDKLIPWLEAAKSANGAITSFMAIKFSHD